MSSGRKDTLLKLATLIPVLIFQLWLTHALAYLAHEYAHSFVAWALRCKANPLALNYGGLNLNNVIFLDDIDENVDYAPIFAAGHGPIAAGIAVSGVLLGNGLFYLLSRRLYTAAKKRGHRMLALFTFLLCLMNVGNFISYVPARTFTTHADMVTVQQGLNISPWWVAIVLGIPFCAAMGHFFAAMLPDAMRFLFPDTKAGQILLLVLSAYMAFKFFGGSGLHRYGEVSHWISAFSIYGLLPLSIILCWPRGRSQAHA